jgi:hypothetical protein
MSTLFDTPIFLNKRRSNGIKSRLQLKGQNKYKIINIKIIKK